MQHIEEFDFTEMLIIKDARNDAIEYCDSTLNEEQTEDDDKPLWEGSMQRYRDLLYKINRHLGPAVDHRIRSVIDHP